MGKVEKEEDVKVAGKDEEEKEESDKEIAVADTNITEVDGIVHYNTPAIDNMEFVFKWCTNTYYIKGKKLTAPAGI